MIYKLVALFLLSLTAAQSGIEIRPVQCADLTNSTECNLSCTAFNRNIERVQTFETPGGQVRWMCSQNQGYRLLKCFACQSHEGSSSWTVDRPAMGRWMNTCEEAWTVGPSGSVSSTTSYPSGWGCQDGTYTRSVNAGDDQVGSAQSGASLQTTSTAAAAPSSTQTSVQSATPSPTGGATKVHASLPVLALAMVAGLFGA